MKGIYFDVENSIKDLQKIFENIDGGDERLRAFNQEALEVFKKLESESLKELESLKNNEEWEKFTIAFYGETGAGKSTLIECLRLFFREPSKMDQQERFKRLYANMKNYESSEHAELEKLQDGAIIGDGRSDFTLETKSYTLKHNNQSFILLDVPGIEGNEKKVKQQISNATRKAHAIFYVTKTPAPPQKGEERKEGTIEKIQKQLDSQTEVYTLFNKPIKSPRALKDGLIDENEKESLKILNEKMKAVLGKHYEGHQVVSAQAAFYGLSSALLPESGFYKNKQKFLEIFKVEELLLKSHFKQLGGFIAGTLLKNSRKKIIESNCNKALKVIEKLQKAITTTIDREIDPTIKELKDGQKETYSNLDRSREKYISNLNNSISKEIERFRRSDLREKMYAHIDRGIEDDECKRKFKYELRQGMKELDGDIKLRFEKDKEQFSKDTKEDIKQFEERIKNSLVMLNHINIDSGFDPIFNIHSGIDKLGLFSSIGGLALLLTVPVLGEIALAAGIVLGAIGVAKSVWNFFDSDHKKSQQKKEVDNNLDEVCEKIEERVRNKIEDAKKGICEKVESLKARLNDPVVCYERMRERLIKAGESLWQIDNNIKTRIAQ
ncbi:hypothetical protein JP0077_10150 [Helicobacter pylori]|uniref:GTPase n=1 Tax=Helicobacter pylori TaxID=210 RepID=UPI001AA522C1|nr:GTPase [Helicobacter pylori]GHQ77682.1 hypothetical protein JP0077_10150 [Helicobacter pylori]